MKKMFYGMMIAIILLSSCSFQAFGRIGRLDIEGASGFTIIRSLQESDSEKSDHSGLYKVISGNNLEEVTAYNELDMPMDMPDNLQFITEVSDQFLMVGFGHFDNTCYEAYLVDRDNGRTWIIDNDYLPKMGREYYVNSPIAYSDRNGVMYWIGHKLESGDYRDILVVCEADSGDMTVRDITPGNDDVSQFLVDAYGNIIYDCWGTSFGNPSRLLHKNGRVENLEIDNLFVGIDGHFQYFSSHSNPDEDEMAKGYIGNDGTLAFRMIPVTSEALMEFTNTHHFWTSLYHLQGDLYAVDHQSGSSIIRIDSRNGHDPVSISFDLKITSSDVSDDTIYLAGRYSSDDSPGLIKYNPSTNLFTTLLPASDGEKYSVEVLSVDKDNNVRFSGFRMRDGRSVIGAIDSTGHLSIIKEGVPPEAVYLTELKQ